MATINGRVDVGDEKTLEIAPTDADGNPLTVSGAEVKVSSPSGKETTYTKSDMIEDGSSLFLDLTFDEAGFWFAEIEVTNAGGQETDRRVYRARTREAKELSLLTRDAWHEYLSEEAMAEGPDTLQRLIKQAERKVLNRYREVAGRHDDLILDAQYDSDVQLDGYVEDDQGNPDLQEMDPGLLDSLRAAVARVVEWHVGRPDQAEHVARMDEGDRSVTFRDKGLPPSVFAPLRPFDERDPWY